jgi:hypothetical protein
MGDREEEASERWARLIGLACPLCHTEVLVLDLPTPPWIWCARCVNTPRLERTAV